MQVNVEGPVTHAIIDASNGEEVEVLTIRPDAHGLTVELENGRSVVMDLSHDKFKVYYQPDDKADVQGPFIEIDTARSEEPKVSYLRLTPDKPGMTRCTVKGERKAKQVVAKLVESSCHFELLPLPDDSWEIAVKSDRADALGKAVAELDETYNEEPCCATTRQLSGGLTHIVPLSNGELVGLQEQEDRLAICLMDRDGTVEDYYVADITDSGVLVMPNSGDACQCLSRRPTKAGDSQ